MRSPGCGELSLSAYPGVGNRPPNENKIANPRGYARGGIVTGRIEPCISDSRDGGAGGGWGGFSPPTFEEDDILFCFSIWYV